MEKREHSYTVGGNANWRSHHEKQYGRSLKTKGKAAVWYSNSTPGCVSEKKKKIVRQKGFFNGSAGKESACNAGDTGDMG